MNSYNWGIDGYGRAHIYEYPNMAVIFCALPDVPATLAIDALELWR